MLRYSEFVIEAFDSKYPWKWDKMGHNSALASFHAGASGVDVMFAEVKTDKKTGDQTFEVLFSRNRKMDVTGQGDALPIMATVLDIIKDFISKKNPYKITFSSSKTVGVGNDGESGRTKLYTALVRRFATAMGYTFDINSTSSRFDDKFELTRKTDA